MAVLGFIALALFAGVAYGSPARIIGGSDTTIEEYPFLVQVEFEGTSTGMWSQSCGGSILTSAHVLSAAHCFHGALYAPNRRRVRCGDSNRRDGGIVSHIMYEINHHTYGQNGDDGDITVVRLVTQLEFGPGIGQGVIVSQGFDFPANIPVNIAGWGTTQVGGLPSDQLQVATIYTIDHEVCKNRYQEMSIPMEVTDNMICTGLLDVGGIDACQGDYGGPVFYDNIIVGVSSWGVTCGDGRFPSVATAVASYSDWILSVAIN